VPLKHQSQVIEKCITLPKGEDESDKEESMAGCSTREATATQ